MMRVLPNDGLNVAVGRISGSRVVRWKCLRMKRYSEETMES